MIGKTAPSVTIVNPVSKQDSAGSSRKPVTKAETLSWVASKHRRVCSEYILRECNSEC